MSDDALAALAARIATAIARQRRYQARSVTTGDLRWADRAANLDGPLDRMRRRYYRALLKGRR